MEANTTIEKKDCENLKYKILGYFLFGLLLIALIPALL